MHHDRDDDELDPSQSVQPGQALPSGEAQRARIPARWIWVAVLVGIGAAAIGWGMRAQGIAAAREGALRDAHEALDHGKIDAATTALDGYLDADGDAADAEFAWVTGRLKAAQNDAPAARQAYAQAAAGAAAWPMDQQLSLALHRVESAMAIGGHDEARQLCDDALALGADVLDAHLDRDDLGPNGLPAAADAVATDASLPLMLELLVRRVRIGTSHADALAGLGDDEAAIAALDATESIVTGRICTGTHRIVCRGDRGDLLARVVAPLRSARVRVVVAGALVLARAGKVDDAQERLEDAVEKLTEASRGPEPSAEDTDALRMSANVGYALQVVAAERAEAEHDFHAAQKRWEAAAETWQKLQASEAARGAQGGPGAVASTAASAVGASGQREATQVGPMAVGPGPAIALAGSVTPTTPIHVAGLRRARAIAAILERTSATVDLLGRFGLGDEDRRKLHAAILAQPRDVAVYLDAAVASIQRSRRADRDPEQAKADLASARELVEVASAVRPDAVSAQFWHGVIDVLDGHPARGIPAMASAWAQGGLSVTEARLLAEAYDGIGRVADAAAMFVEVWQLRPDDSGAARRAVLALLSLGRRDDAASLLRKVREAHGDDPATLEAAAALALAQGQPQQWASARLALDGTPITVRSDAMVRGQRIATAMTSRARAQLSAQLRPGEVVLETVFGQAISAQTVDAIARKRLQCAVLIFTDQRVLLLRWDAERDLGAAVRKGSELLRHGLRLGADLGLETIGLDPGTWGARSGDGAQARGRPVQRDRRGSAAERRDPRYRRADRRHDGAARRGATGSRAARGRAEAARTQCAHGLGVACSRRRRRARSLAAPRAVPRRLQRLRHGWRRVDCPP